MATEHDDDNVVKVLGEKHVACILETLNKKPIPAKYLMHEMKLTRKQAYLALAKLTDQGLLARSHGQYQLTIFGKIMYNYYTKLLDITDKYRLFLTMVDETNRVTSNKKKSQVKILIKQFVKDPELLDMIFNE